ncbi:putative E3 ubiquitin-protein ligase pub1 [Blattamonas nauphoetae]|uniref:HECT-type E3 ubiquitin transferase n=1 Tax=Blattamonas nauphoetae TaxID=2049346 RepID=A0ABQ9XA25_9EUKA|nr:putative E3 ubiquitin-protein ligase pub1 [Blattamonas nauphoetae]
MKTSNSAECGTMQFWAPEFFKKKVGTDTEIGSPAGDMWAFGQLLFEIMTTRSWIDGGTAVEIEKTVLRFDIGKICASEGIVGDVQVLLSLLLSKNPSQRISSADLVRSNRLQSVLGPETPLSRFIAEQLEEKQIEVEITRKQLQNEQKEKAKEHETLIKEKSEHQKTKELVQRQKQEESKDKTKIQSLEKELLDLKEENTKLKATNTTSSIRPLRTSFSDPFEIRKEKFLDALSAIHPLAKMGTCKITFPPDANIAKSMVAMYNKTRAELLQPFFLILEGTNAIDVNGIKRWFFTKIVEKINDPKDIGLFTPDGTGKGTLTIPSDPKFKGPTFLQIYKFAGLILGKVMLERLYVPFRFNKFIWKLLQGHPMEQEDLQSLGRGHHDNLEATLNSYSLIVTAMRSELHSLVPDHVLRLLSPEELELMVCGKTEIDVADWKRRTYYTEQLSSHPQVISAFWTMMDRADNTMRREILRLGTGLTNAPPTGFADLKRSPVDSTGGFTLSSLGVAELKMPEGTKSFNRLDIPLLEDPEKMRTAFLMAIRNAAPPTG